ncbi:hypothetical protein LTR67_007492 [Exophiala xenobiotica]
MSSKNRPASAGTTDTAATERLSQVARHISGSQKDGSASTSQSSSSTGRRTRRSAKGSRNNTGPPADYSDVLSNLAKLNAMAHTPDLSNRGYVRQKREGKLWVRERLEQLVDKDSFKEIGSASGRVEWKQTGPRDEEPVSFTPTNNLQGFGMLGGRKVIITADDYSIRAGHADGAISDKTIYSEKLAVSLNMPIIKLTDGSSGGGSVTSIKTQGWSYVPGVPGFIEAVKGINMGIPNLAAVLGPAIGIGAARAVISHFSVMAGDIGSLFNAGPQVVEGATFEEGLTLRELGGPGIHCTNGTIDNLAANEAECFEQIRRVLSYLPNCGQSKLPPVVAVSDPIARVSEELRTIIPRRKERMYDARAIVATVFDAGSWFEIGALWGRTAIVGLARLGGRPVGVISLNCEVNAGALDAGGSQKITRHLKLCDVMNIPIVQFVDVPGYAIGTVAERQATMRWGVELGKAYISTTIPIFSVLTRRVFGVADGIMVACRDPMMCVAWPSGEWGSLPLDGGIEVGHRWELKQAEAEGKKKELYTGLDDEYRRLMNPIRTANAFGVEEIIDPAHTRRVVAEWAVHMTVDTVLEMSLPTAVAVAAVSTALGLYLDAKYSIGSDIAQIRGAWRLQRYAQHLYEIHGEDDWSFYHVLHSTYGSNDDQEAFVFEGRSWTYRRLREEIGRWADALKRLGVRNRMVVGLFINNSPEFMFTWWALYKLGAIPAPINTSITGGNIKHCLKVSEAEMLITTFELSGIIAQTFDLNDDGTGAFESGDPSCARLGHIVLYDHDTYPSVGQWSSRGRITVMRHSEFPLATPEMGDFPKSSRPKVLHTDASQYLFTSGTTGLPKALIWPAGYSLSGSCPDRYPGMHDKRRRFYICLPMFHGTATFAGMPATFSTSGTVILARRFSRREFWADVRRSRANAILYIGEMLRYLVQSPPDARFPDEKNHEVDLAFGLGLAPTVWRAVRERFGIPWIVEYYSASEATISILNSNKNDLGVGKVAHYGPLMRSSIFQDKFYIVRTDLETGEILRDPKTGFCMRTRAGEVGESICRISPPVQRRHDYVGEGGKEATEKKVLRNVFARGDEFFRLGDAMARDQDGFVSFHDRLGDTYRAKGHNISTTEVEGCLSRHPNIASVNVYAIPMNRYGYDGQLGCAAITFTSSSGSGSGMDSEKSDAQEQETVRELEKWTTTNANGALPAYAVPRFLRVLVNGRQELDGGNNDSDTGADRVSLIMKKLKTGLRQEGFSLPRSSSDRMYWIEKEGFGYVPLTDEAVQVLLSGKARL